jgi:hypothetical protein
VWIQEPIDAHQNNVKSIPRIYGGVAACKEVRPVVALVAGEAVCTTDNVCLALLISCYITVNDDYVPNIEVPYVLRRSDSD